MLGNENILNDFSIAIIGSRNCTSYGKKIAEKLSYELAEIGICIVSGMAKGIDTYAHKGALKAKGKTIAVLGSGFENIYPIENKELFFEIIHSKGTVISEYSPETPVRTENFPKRNRIVSGISNAVLVIEAAYRSGTSITVNFAKQQGKKVFCVPSGISSSKGVGTNKMIQEGAKLITGINDILQEFEEWENCIKIKKEIKNSVPLNCLEVYEIIKYEDIHINSIFEKSNKNIAEIYNDLIQLEILDLIEELPGKFYRRCFYE